MDESPDHSPKKWPISRLDRLALGLAVVLLLALLSVAAWLQPSENGLGTHQQLGLPPCTFRVLFGKPCPTCGMTTSWSCLVRGRLFDAFGANPAGAVLGLGAVLALPWMAVSAAIGRWWLWRPPALVVAVASIAVALLTLIVWIVRLWSG